MPSLFQYAETMAEAQRRSLFLMRAGHHTEAVQVTLFASYINIPDTHNFGPVGRGWAWDVSGGDA